jgi:hypothetical protein
MTRPLPVNGEGKTNFGALTLRYQAKSVWPNDRWLTLEKPKTILD